MKVFLISFLVIYCSISILAQEKPSENMTPAEIERLRQIENRRVDESINKLGEMNNISRTLPASTKMGDPYKLSEKQKKKLAPLPEDSAKYKRFLKNSKTGLVKIFPDVGCGSQYVVNVSEKCENLIPFSSSYSFRYLKHITSEDADISLKDNHFFSGRELLQGILVTLGDIPIEDISIKSEGLEFLADYHPPKERADASVKAKEIENGIKHKEFIYSNKVSVKENTTYAIRIIAYRKKVLNFYDNAFNKKRKDITTVFRVVRIDKDGAVTLLWKELQRKDAPEIEYSKENKNTK